MNVWMRDRLPDGKREAPYMLIVGGHRHKKHDPHRQQHACSD
jgi:hypothetical protein